MSDITIRDNTHNQLTADRNLEKLLMGFNDFEQGTFLNNTGAPLTLKGGELIGRITASGKLAILKSASTNGSQIPVGVNVSCTNEIAAGAEVKISFCIKGELDKGLVILDGTDTFDTVISGRTIGDRIKADTAGIILRSADQLTKYDN